MGQMMPMLPRLTIKRLEIALGIFILVVMGVVIWEAIKLGPGWGRMGPQPGMFVMLLGLIAFLATLGHLVQVVIRGGDDSPFFESLEGFRDLVKVGVPLLLTAIIVRWLGFYVISLLYVWGFTSWYGRMRWYISFPIALALTFGAYYGLEKGFRLFLIKGFWYPSDPIFAPFF